MTVKTTYTCDLCDNTQEDYSQFWSVKVTAKPYISRYNTAMSVSSPDQSIDCCRLCLERRLGLKISKETRQDPDFKQTTIEEAILEVVNNAVADALQEQRS